MEVNKSMARGSYKRLVWLALIGIVLVFLSIATLLIWHTDRTAKPTAGQQTVGQKTTQHKASDAPVTAGGVAVPLVWQGKARRLGYYCPSWDAKSGQVASAICIPLDK